MPSVTFHVVCPPSNRRKDGTIPVKIRVTFRGLHRYLATTLVARPADLTRTLHIKNPTITARAGELEQELSSAQANTAKLRSTYESRIDLAQIEARARELGMSQPSARQTVYLNIAGADHAEVLQVDDRSYVEKAWDAVTGSFRGVVEYFR